MSNNFENLQERCNRKRSSRNGKHACCFVDSWNLHGFWLLLNLDARGYLLWSHLRAPHDSSSHKYWMFFEARVVIVCWRKWHYCITIRFDKIYTQLISFSLWDLSAFFFSHKKMVIKLLLKVWLSDRGIAKKAAMSSALWSSCQKFSDEPMAKKKRFIPVAVCEANVLWCALGCIAALAMFPPQELCEELWGNFPCWGWGFLETLFCRPKTVIILESQRPTLVIKYCL